MRAELKVGGREIIIKDVKKLSEFGKFVGLMFTRRGKAQALLFDFRKEKKISIHSLFVFFPFIAIWLDKERRVVEIKKVEPWKLRILPKKPFKTLIEVPINADYIKVNEAILKSFKSSSGTKDL